MNQESKRTSFTITFRTDVDAVTQYLEPENQCYCDRDITEDELKDIVKQLREKDDVRDVQKTVFDLKETGFSIHSEYKGKESNFKVYKNDDGIFLAKWGSDGYYTVDTKDFVQKNKPDRVLFKKSAFDDQGIEIFDSKETEKIKASEINDYKLFAEYLNMAFNEYKINSCLRKIHFLAQCYHESARFIDTYEGRTTVPKSYNGGVSFQGRGIKQITHDYNYLACYDEQQRFIHEKANSEEELVCLFDDIYMKKRYSWTVKEKNKTVTYYDSVTAYLEKNGTEHGFPKDFIVTLKDFAKKISTNLKDACMSAGFFWRHQDVHGFADRDDVKGLTKKINGGTNGLTERQKYTDDLKEIFCYENCKKNKK